MGFPVPEAGQSPMTTSAAGPKLPDIVPGRCSFDHFILLKPGHPIAKLYEKMPFIDFRATRHAEFRSAALARPGVLLTAST